MPKTSNMSKKRSNDSTVGQMSKKQATTNFWKQGLLASMNDSKLKVKEDDQIVIIKDKYPKAKHHFLVLPKENIPSLKSLKKSHIPLLNHMHREGLSLADEYGGEFKLGYHAVPSMAHLHLHVISTDMDSQCLKHKKHWNSFTTDYFIPSEKIIKELEDTSTVNCVTQAKSKELLDTPLACHVCKKGQKNMPTLKTHIKEHFSK